MRQAPLATNRISRLCWYFGALLCACFFYADLSHAQFSGTISGRVSTTDFRINPYTSAFDRDSPDSRLNNRFAIQNLFGLPPRTTPNLAIPDILVHVKIEFPFFLTKEFWTKTNASGIYSVNWSDVNMPTKMIAEVWAASPAIDDGIVINNNSNVFLPVFRPANRFRITSALAENILISTRTDTTPQTGATSLNFSFIQSSEIIAAYQTAQETYDMLDEQSLVDGALIANDMTELKIFANKIADEVNNSGGGGVTLKDDDIWIVPDVARSSPRTVSHEIGHIVEWRALDVKDAPLLIFDYACDFEVLPTWGRFTNECQKASFQEGFADLVAVMWMWKRTATAPIYPLISSTQSLETPPSECNSEPHRKAGCITVALWDIVDKSSNLRDDDDHLNNRDLGSLVKVFRSYPRDCDRNFNLDNGCVNEGDINGMNWKDFKRNYENVFGLSTSLNTIEDINNMEGALDD